MRFIERPRVIGAIWHEDFVRMLEARIRGIEQTSADALRRPAARTTLIVVDRHLSFTSAAAVALLGGLAKSATLQIHDPDAASNATAIAVDVAGGGAVSAHCIRILAQLDSGMQLVVQAGTKYDLGRSHDQYTNGK